MSKNDKELLSNLKLSDPNISVAISNAFKLGEDDNASERGNDSVTLAKAKFMSETLTRMQPIILKSAREASKRTSRARHFKAYASLATTFFSAATLSLVSLVAAVKVATWTAVGSTLAALCTMFSDYVGRIGDGEKPITASQASNELIELNYSASVLAAELSAHLAVGKATPALVASVNEANALCRQANSLAGLLGNLQPNSTQAASSASQGDLNA